jgi:hypothetical protein
MNTHRLETFGILLGTIWCVVGPLVGVVIGIWLARCWQRKHRLLESKRTEYRELCPEDWEKLRDVLVKMSRRELAILNESSPLVLGGHGPHPQ